MPRKPRKSAHRVVETFASFGNILNNITIPKNMTARLELRSELKSVLMTVYTIARQRLAEFDPGKQGTTEVKLKYNESFQQLRTTYTRMHERIESEKYRNPRARAVTG